MNQTSERFVKHLNVDNWQQPDPTLALFRRYSEEDGSLRKVTGEDWARGFLAIELNSEAPLEVYRLFEVARGSLVYGYFFYPLYTIGTEQLFRVADAAVSHKCRELGISATRVERLSFMERVNRLIDKGMIPSEDKEKWDAIRHLRNLASHPDDQTILPPGFAIDELRRIATEIDALFDGRDRTDVDKRWQ